jgi:hypothetical protein
MEEKKAQFGKGTKGFKDSNKLMDFKKVATYNIQDLAK